MTLLVINTPQQTERSAQEFEEWAKTLRTSPDRLREAVHVVGITPRKIRAYLRAHPTPGILPTAR